MVSMLTYSENTKKISNSCSSIGRPIKGFEKWRKEALETEPIEFIDFLKESFEDIRQRGGELTLGFVDNETWKDYEKGMQWNRVKVVFPGEEPKYRSFDSFKTQYSEYVTRFYKWQARIAAGL